MSSIRELLSVPIHGTPRMRSHLQEHDPADSALRFHKIANSVAGFALLTGGLLLGQEIVSRLDEESQYIQNLYEAEFSAETSLSAAGNGIMYGVTLGLESIMLFGGMALAGNANASYRRQQEL